MRTLSTAKWGFTLIELMIVITIIAVLLAIMLPNVTRSRQQAILSSCEHNERNIAAALEVYNTQYKRYPSQLQVIYPNYMKKATCPTNKSDYGYQTDTEGKSFTLQCEGTHYLGVLNIPQYYPKFTPTIGLLLRESENSNNP